jgi:hypothetical protein
MKLLEVKGLVQFNAIGSFMVTKHDNGWILCVLKKDSNNQSKGKDVVLESARGGYRVFKTLDAIKKLMDSDLDCSNFLVV